MNKVTITELGLAAYLRIKDAELVKYENGFVFETDRSEGEWRIEYYNSDCYKHDSELLQLKKFIVRK